MGVFSHVDDVLDQRGLLDKFEAVFVRAYVPDGPQDGSLLLGGGLFTQKRCLKFLDVIALLDQRCSLLSLYELSKQMHRCLDDFVLLRKNLDLKDDRLQESFETS